MLMKNIINTDNKKVGVRDPSPVALSAKVFQLRSTIEELPQECLYREYATEVLKKVDFFVNGNLRSSHEYPPKILDEILDKTKELIDPKTDPAKRLKLSVEYDEYARKLKWCGHLSIFVGVMCILAAVVCLALIAAGILLMTHLYPLGMGVFNPSPAPALGAISVMSCLGVLSVWILFEATDLFFGGSASRKLIPSLQGLMIKVKEDIYRDYNAGMNCLDKGEIAEGLEHLSKVTKTHPCYQKAQIAIQSVNMGNSAEEAKPSLLNELIERVKALEEPPKRVSSLA